MNELIKKRKEIITKYIVEEEAERHTRKIRTTIDNLRKEGNGVREDAFWQFKRIEVIQDQSCKVVKEKEQILEAYKAFYGKLFEKGN